MRKFFKSALFIIALAGVAAFAACGSSERGPSRTVGEYLADRSLLYGTTIAIAHVPQIRVGGTQRQHFGMELLAQRFMLANPGITIEFRAFDSPEQATELIGLDLMSGMSEFTLINSLGIDWRSPVVTRLFLADWFEIMNAAPDFNPDDWFMNVFDAMAKDGRLHVFPTDFRYEVVVANSSVPGLAEAFARYDFITHSDLQRLHQEFSTEQQPYMFFAYNIHWGVMYNLGKLCKYSAGGGSFSKF
ncbi:MAG: hypothetical protein FWB71_04310 [Defluviitaleaceae bacterium]|nr:hypothetical protein [Defluviitaleaceae bacterium]